MSKLYATSRIKRLACFILAVCGIYTANVQSASHDTWDYSLGYDYSEGQYGETRKTIIHYAPLSISYKSYPLKLKLTVPYLWIQGPGSVIGGVDGGVVINPENKQHISEQGLGDSIFSATYSLDNQWNSNPFVDVTAKIKFPTGDRDKNLGTGEMDVSVLLDIASTYNAYTPFWTAGYKMVGDPASIDYNNSFFASIGLDYKHSDSWSGGVLLDYRQAISKESEDPVESIIYLSRKTSQHTKLMGYFITGFSDGSPDSGFGLQLKYMP